MPPRWCDAPVILAPANRNPLFQACAAQGFPSRNSKSSLPLRVCQSGGKLECDARTSALESYIQEIERQIFGPSRSTSGCESPPRGLGEAPLEIRQKRATATGSDGGILRTQHLRAAFDASSHGNFERAYHIHSNALLANPSDANMLNLRGMCSHAQGKPLDAFRDFLRAVEIDPSNAAAHNNQGVIYRELELLEAAVLSHWKALDLDRTFSAARRNLAVACNDLGTAAKLRQDMACAYQWYEEALKADAAHGQTHFNLGVFFSECNCYERAAECYREAIRLDPANAKALNNLGMLVKAGGKVHEAVSFFEKALQAEPNFALCKANIAVALNDLGTLTKHGGSVKEAIRLYHKSLSHNPYLADAYYNLGVAYGERRKLDKSRMCYSIAILLNQNSAETYNNLGVIYKECDDLESAFFCYRKALEIKPDFAYALNNVGLLLHVLGRVAEAYEYSLRAAHCNPHFSEVHNNLGVLLRDFGDIEGALAMYERCLQVDPACERAKQN
eukprot:Polyplicarium_translucidae@DN1804_c0_g1_i2.p1